MRKVKLLTCGILVLMMFSVVVVKATTYYSVANANWYGSSTTWATTSGGTAGTYNPTSSDAVIIERGYTVTVNNSSCVCASLTLGSASGVTHTGSLAFATTGSPALVVSGAVTIGDGTAGHNGTITFQSGSGLTCNSVAIANNSSATITMTAGSTMTVNGAITVTAGTGTHTFTQGTGTLVLGASSTLPTTTFTAFNNLTINNGVTIISGVSFSVAGTMTVNGVFTPGAAHVISGAGTLTGSGTVQVTRTVATADFATQYTITTKTLTNLTVDYHGTGEQLTNTTYGSAGSGGLNVSGSITGATNTATVAGTFTVSGTFTPTGGTITMSGTGWGITNSGTLTFYGLTIAGTPVTQPTSGYSIAGILTVNVSTTFAPTAGTITMSAATSGITNNGTLTFNNLTISTTPTAQTQYGTSYSIAGTLTVSSGVTFSPSSGTITMSAATSGITNSGTLLTFYNLIITTTPTAQTQYGTSYSVAGTLTVNSSVTFSPSSGTITMTGTAWGISNSGTLTFYALTISGTPATQPTASFSVASTLKVAVTMTLAPTAGTITMSAATSGITNSGTLTFYNLTISTTPTAQTQYGTSYSIAGTLTVNSSVTFSPSSGTITMTGTAWGISNSGTLTFYALTISGTPATQPTASFSVASTLTVSGSVTLAPTAGTITMSAATSGITNSGTLTFYNLTISTTPTAQTQYGTSYSISGTLTVNSGVTFSPSSGTITMSAATSGITNSGTLLKFYNLIITTTPTAQTQYGTSYSIAGTLTVNSSVTFSPSSGTITMSAATSGITNSGTLTFNNLTITTTPTAQTQYGTSYTVAGTLNVSAVTFTPTGGTVTMSGASGSITSTATTLTFSSLTISGTVTGSGNFGVGTTMTVNGTFTPAAAEIISGAGTLTGSGTVQVTRTVATADFASQYTITTKTLTNLTVDYHGTGEQLTNTTYGSAGSGGLNVSGSITGATNTATVAGTFTVSGTFTPTGGTITMSGTGWGITNSGTLTFYGLTIAGTPVTQPTSGYSIAGILTVNVSTTFAPTAGTITMSAATSGITNNGTLTFNNLTISTTPTAQTQYGTSYTVAGTLNVSAVTFTPTGGTVTMSGASGSITSTATTLTFSSLTISGTVTGSGNFGVGTTMTVNGTFTPAAAEIISGAGTLTGSGTVQVTRTAVTADFASQYTITTKTLTNLTVDYNGTGEVLTNLTYYGLKVSGSITGASNTATVTGTFNVTGTFTPTSGTITMSGTGWGITNSGTLTFYGLTIAGTPTSQPTSGYSIAGILTVNVSTTFAPTAGTITMSAATSGITNNGTLTFNNLTIAATPTSQSQYNASYSVAGTLIVNSAVTFSPSGGTTTFNGSSAQTIGGGSATSFYNLVINNSAGVSLSGVDATVSNTFDLHSGNFTTGSNKLIISNNAAGAMTRSGTGQVVGNLQRAIAASGSPTYTFYVGTSSSYTPVDVAFTTLSGGGNLTAYVAAGQESNSGTPINTSKDVGLYWNLTNSGVTFTSYGATFHYNSGDIIGGGTQANFIVGKYSSSTWTRLTATNSGAGPYTSFVSGLTAFSDFVVGEPVASSATDHFKSNAAGNWSSAATWLSSPDNTTWWPATLAPTSSATDITIQNTGTVTVDQATQTASTIYINSSGALTNSTTNNLQVYGNWSNSGGTFTPATGTVTFMGTSIQSIGGSSGTTFNNLTINNSTNTVSLGYNQSIAGNLSVLSGSVLDLGTYTANRGTSGGTLTVAGTLKLGGTSGGTSGSNFPTNFTTFTMTSGTVEYSNTGGGQTIYATPSYNNLTLDNTGGTNTAGGALTVNGTLTTTASGTLDMSTYALGGTLSGITNNGTITTACISSPLPSGKNWGSGEVDYYGAGGQTFVGGTYTTCKTITAGNYVANGDITVSSLFDNGGPSNVAAILDMGTYNLNISGTFGNGGATTKFGGTANGHAASGGGTIIYDGSNQTVDASFNSGKYAGNLFISEISGTASLGGDITVQHLIITSGTLDMNSHAITGVASNNDTLTINNGTSLKISGTSSFPSNFLALQTIGSTSTEEYSGASQTIATLNSLVSYGNLVTSGSGTKTAAGVISATTLDNGGASNNAVILDMGVNVLTVSSTIDNTNATAKFSGVSNGIAISTGTVEYSVTTGGQTIAAGTYNNLTLDNTSGTNTTGGIVTVNGAYTTPSGGTLSTGYNITFNGTTTCGETMSASAGTVEYGVVTGSQNILSGTYYSLKLDNTSGTNTACGNLVVNTGTLTTKAGGTLDMGTTGILSGSGTFTNSGIIKTSVPTGTSTTPVPTGKTWAGTIEYGAAGGSQTIVSGTYNNLSLDNTSGTDVTGGTVTISAAFTTPGGGTLSTGYNITFNGTTTCGETMSASAGTVEYGVVTGSQNILSGTYYSLKLDNTSGTNTACGNLVVNTGTLTTTAGGTLDMGTTGILSGSGTFTNSGIIKTSVPTGTSTTPVPTGKTWAGTIEYGAAGGSQTIVSGTYNNLSLDNTSGTDVTGGTVTISAAFTTPGGGTLSTGYNITFNGTTTCGETMSASAGTVEYGVVTGSQNILSGTYYSLKLDNTSGTNTACGNLVVNTGTLTTTAGGTLDMGTTGILSGSGTFTNSGIIKTSVPTGTSTTPVPTGKTWAGTIEYGAAGGSQTIVTGTYTNLTMDNTSGTNTIGGNITINSAFSSPSGGTISTSHDITFNGTTTCGETMSASAGTVTYASSTGGQNVLAGTYNNLTSANSTGTLTACGSINVTGTLSTPSGTVLNMGGYTLTASPIVITGATIKFSGASNGIAISTGTVEYSVTTGGQTIAAGTYNNLTLDNTSGTNTTGGIVTVNGAFSSPSSAGTLSTAYSITFNGSVSCGESMSASAGTVSYTISSGGQKILAGTYNNLTSGNSSGTNTACGDLTVNGTLATTSGGTVDLSTYALGGTLSTITNSGTLETENIGSTPFASGKTWSGTIIYSSSSSSAQTVVSGTYNNLTLDNSYGVSASGSFTVNGILYLQSTNPSATQGNLDMGASYSLTMGGSATTTGPGDVTGIVTRTSISPSASYTFGNQYTTINFMNIGTLPTSVSVKITIGTAPVWKTDAVKRTYDVIQTGAIGNYATMNMHYLDGELNGNTKSNMVTWASPSPTIPGSGFEYGRSNYSITNDWVGISSTPLSLIPSTFGQKAEGLGNTNLTTSTWTGALSTDWVNYNNWSPAGVPADLASVVIPDAATTTYSPTLGLILKVGRITINSGGILNAIALCSDTISGASGAWSNNGGTFNASTSTIIFTNAAATMSGTTNFYNVTINSGADLELGSTTIMRIGGTMINNGTWQVSQNPNTTVEYNGSSQTVVEPNGSAPGYDNLILSGSGSKTAAAALTIIDDLTLGSGTTFIGGSYTHNLGGNWTNSGGSFTSTGSTINFNGTGAQTIITGGSGSGQTFNNMTINKTTGIATISTNDASVTGTLTISSGELDVSPSMTLTAATMSNSVGAGGLVIKSDATGTANLVENTPGISGTVQRYIFGDPTYKPTHFISSPINNSPFSNIFTTGDYNVYWYDETVVNADLDQGWARYGAGTLDNCKGYSVVGKANVVRSFAGTMNAASMTAPVTYTATTMPGGGWTKGIDPRGWNLIGNPFPCALAVTGGSGFLNDNSSKLDATYSALYYWDNPDSSLLRADYASFNFTGGTSSSSAGNVGTAGNFIPVGQGFFVKLKDNGGGSSYSTTLAFNTTQKIANSSSQFFISGPDETKRIWLDVSDKTGLFNEILVGFTPFATTGFDQGYDAVKLKANSNISLYSILGDKDLIIQGLPPITDQMVVPIGLDVLNAGELTLNVKAKENFTTEKVYLKDLLENKLIDLNTDTFYTFSVSSGSIRNRFELVFAPQFVSIDPDRQVTTKNPDPVVYSNGNSIFIKNPVNTNLVVQVYDILGKKVEERKLGGAGINTIDITGSQGYYIVKVTGDNTNFSKKIFVK